MTREWTFSPRRSGAQVQAPAWLRKARLRHVAIAALVSCSLAYFLFYTTLTGLHGGHHIPLPGAHPPIDVLPPPLPNGDLTTRKHPIDDLILSARAEFSRVLRRQSHNVKEAADRYRAKRGRHPPPGFDKWFDYTQNKSSIVIEDFFDRIYHDLDPFWAIEARLLRYQARAHDFVVSVRSGNTTFTTDGKRSVPWLELWAGLVEDIQKDLPDVDMPVNMMDESRLVVPWEDIDECLRKAELNRSIIDPAKVITTYTRLSPRDAEWVPELSVYDPKFRSGQYWDIAKAGCHPNSTSRNTPPWAPLEEPTLFPSGRPQNSVGGFVANWTLAKQICDKPYLRGMHGSFIEPLSISTSQQLIPLFGGSKLPINNEILIPPATYLNSNPMYSGGDTHGSSWSSKYEKLFWRGVASGGRNKAESWHHFQRHRFVQMLNGTRVLQAEQTRIRGETFDLPGWEDYNLKAVRNGYLGEWLTDISDVAFIDLLCFPGTNHPKKCPYTEPFFQIPDAVPMSEMYASKYLPDIDGNSFSGRYRAFLRSTSVPIKATIYNEWHDDRIFPWVHFVPMDNTYQDIYGILDYFIGYEGLGSHDEMAERIAIDGKEWAEKFLRREDMAVYLYRLLLEWARICDDNRANLGFIDDLGYPS